MARVLLIVGGGIAAYKSAELIRALRKRGDAVTPVLTRAGAQFVTPLTLGALAGSRVYTDLFDLKDEVEMGHIELSRSADAILVCPATADLMARMAVGIADDLATTLLLATDAPVLIAPAMNVRMWQHPATMRNVATVRGEGVTVMEPDVGEMACGEFGPGRLPEIERILVELDAVLAKGAPLRGSDPATSVLADQPDFADDTHRALHGRHLIVTAGPTHEPIDPVRYLANRSSGKQGFAIAEAAARAGARVTLIAGPVALPTPPGVDRVDVETAQQMADAVASALPADVAVMVAAVADWRPATHSPAKIKKNGDAPAPLVLAENPDILATLAHSPQRPALVVGFAAETDALLDHAQAKLARKGCDWIVANDVGVDPMGGAANRVHLVTADGVDSWERLPKEEVARRLIDRIADALRPPRD